MRNSILILFTVFAIQSCSSPQKRVETSDSTTVVDLAAGEDSSNVVNWNVAAEQKTPIIFKGLYTFGHEVRTFQACGEDQKIYWVNDSLASLQDQYGKTNRFPSYPYESVYAEVKGYLSDKSKLGYASEYENVLVVTEIIKVEAKSFRTDCYNFEFIASGNEPFWSVDIIPQEKRIVFKNVAQEKALEFIYAPATVNGDVYRYEAKSPSNEKLLLVIRQEKCSDGMSDRHYNYSAEVTIDGNRYKGCAIKKGDQFDDQL